MAEKRKWWWFALAAVLAFSLWLGMSEDLDLPYNATSPSGVEEEDAPEIVSFYGQTYETDAIFYVIDRSASMAQGELLAAKEELKRCLVDFSPRMEFGIIAFNHRIEKFPRSGSPARADPQMKLAAWNFVNALRPGYRTCCQAALLDALKMANQATSPRRTIVYLGDGGGTCKEGATNDEEYAYLQQTLSLVAAANTEKVTINCIGILNPKKFAETWMQNLASMNGGRYVRISR